MEKKGKEKVQEYFGKVKEDFNEKVKPRIQKNIEVAKTTYRDKIKPELDVKGKVVKDKLGEGRKHFDDNISPELKKRAEITGKAVKGVKLMSGMKEHFWQELLTNGIALFLAFGVAKSLSYFFVVNSWHNMFGLGGSHGKIAVSSDTMQYLSISVEFIVGLLVFTFIEKFMENFFKIYKEEHSDTV